MLRASPQRRPSRRALWAALPLSVAGHGLLLLLFLGYSALTASPPRPKRAANRPVSLRRIDSRHWASNRGASAPTASVREKPAPLHPEGQVVDVAPGNQQRAPDAKYLAMTDEGWKRQE